MRKDLAEEKLGAQVIKDVESGARIVGSAFFLELPNGDLMARAWGEKGQSLEEFAKCLSSTESVTER